MKQFFALLISLVCTMFSLAAQEPPAPADEPATKSEEEPAPIESVPEPSVPAPQPATAPVRPDTPPVPVPDKPAVLSASDPRHSLTAYTVPANIIRDAAPRNLADALFAVPGLSFREPGAGLAYPILRGASSEAIPVLFSGIPLSGTVFTGGTGAWLSLLDRRFGLETSVSTTPATVEAAAGAIGGAIVVSPFTTDGVRGADEFTPTGRFNTRFSSADTGRDAHARLAGGYGDFGALAMGSVSFTDTRINGSREEQPYSAYENYGVFFIGDWALARSSGDRWHTSVGYLFAQGNDAADLTAFTLDKPSVHFYDRHAHLVWGRLAMTLPSNGIEGAFILSYQNSFEGADTLRTALPSLTRRSDERDETTGHTAGAQADFTAHLIPERLDLHYGVLYAHDWVIARRYTRTDPVPGFERSGIPILSDDASSDRITGYVRSTYELLPPSGIHRISATAGYRFDAFTFRTPGRENIPSVRITEPGHGVEAGFAYIWRENLGAALVYNHGTRAATLREAASYGMRNGVFLVPNNDLDPETSDTLSLSLSGKTKQLAASLSGFATSLTNRIAVTPALWNGLSTKDGYPVAAYQNGERALMWGISSEERLSLPVGLSIMGGATYLWGEEEREDTISFIDTSPPLLWRIAVRWESEKDSEYRGFAEVALRGSTDARSAKRATVGDPVFRTSEEGPWQTLTVRGGFLFDNYIQVILSIENLFDRQYRPVLSSIDGPGIQAVLSLDAEF